ncbi:MAG: hypothetical protein IKQ55_08985 [Kiritimatiellae bacterium]|nr:hypothetical protein [Kiritimatiellia bacterium]
MNRQSIHLRHLLPLAACAAVCASAALMAVGCAQPQPRRPAPVATPPPLRDPELQGLFGVTFGTIKTGNTAYVPERPYRGFRSVTLVAAPVSRQVYRIRSTSHPADVRSEFEGTLRDLERKYGIVPTGSAEARTFAFPNGDTIDVKIVPATKNTPAGVSVDAVSVKVRALNALELRSLDACEDEEAYGTL